MPKKIYIHIGHFKTGSTAIQKMLTKRSASGELERLGFHYPQTGRCRYPHPAHLQILLAEQVLADAGLPVPHWVATYRKRVNTSQLYAQLGEELSKYSARTAVISVESFVRLSQIGPTALAPLKQAIAQRPVEIIIYLRRQDEFLESWFNEVVKNGHPANLNEFTELKLPSLFFDYHQALAPWAQVFGQQNIKVIPYNTSSRKTGVEADFCEAIGLPIDAHSYSHQKRTNPALPVQMLLYKAKINFEHPHLDQSLLTDHMFRRARRLKLPSNSLFTMDERKAILEHCHPSNQLLVQDYFISSERPKEQTNKNQDLPAGTIFAPLTAHAHSPVASRDLKVQQELFGPWRPTSFRGPLATLRRVIRGIRSRLSSGLGAKKYPV